MFCDGNEFYYLDKARLHNNNIRSCARNVAQVNEVMFCDGNEFYYLDKARLHNPENAFYIYKKHRWVPGLCLLTS